MKKNILNSILLVVLIVAIAGCTARKPAATVPVSPPPVNELSKKKSENIKLLKSKDVSFKTLSIKAKANLDINGNKNNAAMNIRMENDKQIWVSITAFAGIEVARALITPDSIKVRNNIQGVYLKKPFSYIHRYTSKQVNFQWLQSILTGNTFAEFLTEQADIAEDKGVWKLQGEKETLAYKVLFDAMMKIKESNINDAKSGQALKIVYSGAYLNVGGTMIPNGLTINSMAGTRRVNIDLEYTVIERNAVLEFPFSVPAKYELVN
ncbi:MAG: DUF4292 domain-containing protein [Pedobacter sp.]|nr:MAG: DUF4292 domain-containing protein [Pedobacter sp.]